MLTRLAMVTPLTSPAIDQALLVLTKDAEHVRILSDELRKEREASQG